MKSKTLWVLAVVGSLLTGAASAQMGGGMGMGPGMAGGKARGFAFDQNNTPGWALMSAEERTAHRDKMLAMKSADECKAYLAEHHKGMEARAKERGKTLNMPRTNACERMQARGLFK